MHRKLATTALANAKIRKKKKKKNHRGNVFPQLLIAACPCALCPRWQLSPFAVASARRRGRQGPGGSGASPRGGRRCSPDPGSRSASSQGAASRAAAVLAGSPPRPHGAGAGPATATHGAAPPPRPGAGLEPAGAAQGGLRAAPPRPDVAAASRLCIVPAAALRAEPRAGQSPGQGKEPVSAGGGGRGGRERGPGFLLPQKGLCFVHPSSLPPSCDWGLLAVPSAPQILGKKQIDPTWGDAGT